MPVIYMPSEECPKCPFNTLCKEKRRCPLSKQAPAKTLDIKEQLRRFAELQTSVNTSQIAQELETMRGHRSV